MEIKSMILITASLGLKILDKPRPVSMGAQVRRNAAVGDVLPAYGVFKFSGVPYAYLVPREINKPEWCQLQNLDGSQIYAEEMKTQTTTDSTLAAAIEHLAAAVEKLKP